MGWIAPIAVAAAQKREEDEALEALRQTYGPGWEFKLLRSAAFGFTNEETLHEALAEEGAAGWQLARQLDSNRLILRRPVAARADDALLGEHYNPYREYYGHGHLVLIGVVLAVLVLGLLGALIVQKSSVTGVAIIFGAIVLIGFFLVMTMWASSSWNRRRKSKG
jgi:hypothetical protein